jgi:hypothetical protein
MRGYKATGIVDRNTLEAISPSVNAMLEIGDAFRRVVVDYRSAYAVSVYDRVWEQSLHKMVPEAGAQVVIIAIIVVAFFAFCAAVIAMQANAQNQQHHGRVGRTAAQELERVREAMAENRPSDLAAKAFQGIRAIVRDFTLDMGERKKLCEDKTHPVERSPACIAALEAYMKALESLNEKLAKLPGGALSIRLDPGVLIEAVLASIRVMVLALNLIGKECQCPFIIF